MTDLSPADGEVTELVEWLRESLDCALQSGNCKSIKNHCQLLDLLGRPTLQPVPEPVAPTDEEIEEWADACYEAPLEEMDPEIHGWRRCFTAKEFSETIRAALDRWGRPTPQPETNAFAIVQQRLEQLAGDQELMIYRWPLDGDWGIDHTNPSSFVQLGEVSGEYGCTGGTLEEAVCKLANLLPTPEATND